MIEIIIISILYAAIRALHDSSLREGEWKKWAFIEGIFVSGIVAYHLHGFIPAAGLAMLSFGMIFWIAFDMFTGIAFGKNPLYIGTTGFDAKVRKIFCYTEKWKGTNYLIFKIVWTAIILKLYTIIL